MRDATPARTRTVALGERAYPIHIGAGILADAGALVADASTRHAIVVTNAVVASHWLAPLRAALAARGIAVDVVLVPDGEAHKNLATLNDVLTRLIECHAERRSLVVALGGGVIGDLAGFAAAIYQRGMPYAQVPTTLLAQVDSSVGGKTAVNHPLGKNMIGAFWQPSAVLVDTNVLSTLPDREFRSGLAEVVKYGAIEDPAFFAWLEAHADALQARDERETGERAHLNFGHTFAHAIETGTGYGEWLHGEAVAAGMVLASRLSVASDTLAAADAARIERLLARLALPVAPPRMPFERWMTLMRRDKKVADAAIRFVLLPALGRAHLRADIGEPALRAILA
jgi:3-dehydroquinate synthase